MSEQQERRRGTNLSKGEIDLIRVCVQSGMGVREIARYLNRNASTISRKIDKMHRDGSLKQMTFPEISQRFIAEGGQDGEVS